MKNNERVANVNAEVRTIAWYEENLAKAKKEWHEIAQSYGVEDDDLINNGYGDWAINDHIPNNVGDDFDYITITDKQRCRRLTYLNNVINSWGEQIRKMKGDKIDYIVVSPWCEDPLANEAARHFMWCVFYFAKYAKYAKYKLYKESTTSVYDYEAVNLLNAVKTSYCFWQTCVFGNISYEKCIVDVDKKVEGFGKMCEDWFYCNYTKGNPNMNQLEQELWRSINVESWYKRAFDMFMF